MNPELILTLIEIATKAAASLRQIRADHPEIYNQVASHHAAALAAAEEAAKLP